jgi:hypothetical protein
VTNSRLVHPLLRRATSPIARRVRPRVPSPAAAPSAVPSLVILLAENRLRGRVSLPAAATFVSAKCIPEYRPQCPTAAPSDLLSLSLGSFPIAPPSKVSNNITSEVPTGNPSALPSAVLSRLACICSLPLVQASHRHLSRRHPLVQSPSDVGRSVL